MDAEEANGLSLQSLAQRLERLERENAELQEEVAELRGSNTPRDGEAAAAEELAGRLSRRALLSKAGAAAVGAVAAGTLLNAHEAKASETPELRTTHVLVFDTTGNNKAAVEGLAGSKGGGGVRGVTLHPDSAGVYGFNSGVDGGYGGWFFGSKAQLLLEPTNNIGKPTTGTHRKGEIYMDSAATLFVCTADGSPGMWRQVTTMEPQSSPSAGIKGPPQGQLGP